LENCGKELNIDATKAEIEVMIEMAKSNNIIS